MALSHTQTHLYIVNGWQKGVERDGKESLRPNNTTATLLGLQFSQETKPTTVAKREIHTHTGTKKHQVAVNANPNAKSQSDSRFRIK